MTDVFFFLHDTFPCWLQKIKQILYFDKKNKNNKNAILKFFTNWPTLLLLLLLFFSLQHLLLCWQQNVKLIWFWTRQIK